MTPAQPLIPFLPQLAALERAPAGRREPAKAIAHAICDVLPIGIDGDAETQSHGGHGSPDSPEVLDDDSVTIARAERRIPQLPRAPLFSQRGVARIPARGSSPDLRRR